MKKLQFAMVGGGNGALIGDIHRIGAQFDDLAELKAGCFSRHWDKNLEAGEKWGVEPGRIYPDYHTMLEEEAKRTGEDRLDFVVVATPNNTHYEIVKDIIAHGFHIVCDKPVTFTSRESEELKALAQEKDLLFGVSYSYAHYAILEQAKKMIADGVLGKIHTIAAEYPQEWVGLNTALRGKDGLTWRVDPAICGPSGVIADIGTMWSISSARSPASSPCGCWPACAPSRIMCRWRATPRCSSTTTTGQRASSGPPSPWWARAAA